MMKKAFTLAEVLITLGIIGVVAAMTLPALIENNKRAELQSQLKVAYSLLTQALTRMNSDLGYPATPEEYIFRKFKDEYIKYFDNAVDCKWGGIHATNVSVLCGKGSYVTNENGSTSQLSDVYNTYSNLSGKQSSSTLFDDGQFALKNGMLVMIENSGAGPIYISVDINGINKRPNIWGYDVFTFKLMSDGKLLPMGMPETGYANNTLYCSKTSTNEFNGVGCTQKALTDKSYWDGV